MTMVSVTKRQAADVAQTTRKSARAKRAKKEEEDQKKEIRLPGKRAGYEFYEFVSEEKALEGTKDPAGRDQRLLKGFTIEDANGAPLSLDTFEIHDEVFLSGCIHPYDPRKRALSLVNRGAKKDGEEAQGMHVSRIGPCTSWRIANYGRTDEEDARIVVETKLAKYVLDRPDSKYRKVHHPFFEQANICKAVYSALSKKTKERHQRSQGEWETTVLTHESDSYEAVVGQIAMAKLTCTGGSNAMTSVNLSGRLIKSQLRLLMPFKQMTKADFNALPFFKELSAHMKSSSLNGILRSQAIPTNASIRIADDPGAPAAGDPSEDAQEDARMDLDMALAQRLQAEEEMRYVGKKQKDKGKEYLRMELKELADDYPVPKMYVKPAEEMDELLMADAEVMGADEAYLPRYTLSDFSIYNQDGFITTLELLPMMNFEADLEIYASGVMNEESQENFTEGGISLRSGTGSSGGGQGGAGGAGGATDDEETESEDEEPVQGIRIMTSDIKQLTVSSMCDLIFVSIRTSAAHYKLMSPSENYAPWFFTLIKVARVATHIVEMVAEASRAASVSFDKVVRSIQKLDKNHDCYISSGKEKVERYLTVHGQVIISQLAAHHKATVKKCALVGQIEQKMAACVHSKLYVSQKKYLTKKNPMMNVDFVKPKQMMSTVTKGVKEVWLDAFGKRNQLYRKMREGEKCGKCKHCTQPHLKKACITTRAKWVAEGNPYGFDPSDEDDQDENEAQQMAQAEKEEEEGKKGKNEVAKRDPFWLGQYDPAKEFAFTKWRGKPKEDKKQRKGYEEALFGTHFVGLNDAVLLQKTNGAENLSKAELVNEGRTSHMAGVVQALWEDAKGKKFVRVWQLGDGFDTVIHDEASLWELFLIPECVTKPLDAIVGKLDVLDDNTKFDIKSTTEKILSMKDEEKHFYRRTWEPKRGLFGLIPEMKFGQLDDPTKPSELPVQYAENDYVYVESSALPWKKLADIKRLWKGSGNYGVHAYHVCQFIESTGKGKSRKATVRRFYRPEDVDAVLNAKNKNMESDLAYSSPVWEVYYSEDVATVSYESLVGKCSVCNASKDRFIPNVFTCSKTWDSKKKTLSKCELDFKTKDDVYVAATETPPPVAKKLSGLDIFAGCGGLTEGMHQADAVDTKWAIEFDKAAAESFKINHPDAFVYSHNCNTLLLCCAQKAGMEEYLATVDDKAYREAQAFDKKELSTLPLPEEVDFICGGPPCQGYSGMNRFGKSVWSSVQNDMVLGFLSWADLYRPKYFLLENVRNFVKHNRGKTFKLVVRTLVELGYQVRFGVVNAGNYGVSQSRKRMFIWGAAPGVELPEWPMPTHVFNSNQLNTDFNLLYVPYTNKNLEQSQYRVYEDGANAPLRAVTVWDTIGDLPPIENGEENIERLYPEGDPVSSFQQMIRGTAVKLTDHICKEMNFLNYTRCTLIPKNQPEHDWHHLEELVKMDSDTYKFVIDKKGDNHGTLVPLCLPKDQEYNIEVKNKDGTPKLDENGKVVMKRMNDKNHAWQGLYGRVDKHGHFPTAITDPCPMGKVGTVFHPEQDRIVSVRECARTQGFPDHFQFYGGVNNKHRQVGNAVPPPLAKQLGLQLKKAYAKSATVTKGKSQT